MWKMIKNDTFSKVANSIFHKIDRSRRPFSKCDFGTEKGPVKRGRFDWFALKATGWRNLRWILVLKIAKVSFWIIFERLRGPRDRQNVNLHYFECIFHFHWFRSRRSDPKVHFCEFFAKIESIFRVNLQFSPKSHFSAKLGNKIIFYCQTQCTNFSTLSFFILIWMLFL